MSACAFCPYTSTPENLARHLLKRHGPLAPFRCAEPGCVFFAFTDSDLRAHLATHAAPPPAPDFGDAPAPPLDATGHGCPSCPFRAANAPALARHVARRHAPEPPPRVTCSICAATLCDRHSLYKHNAACHVATPRWSCPSDGCPLTFRGSLALRRHAAEAHGIQDPFRCAECSVSFTRLTAFEMHRRVHHDTRRTVFRCRFCPQVFPSEWFVARHSCPNRPAAAPADPPAE